MRIPQLIAISCLALTIFMLQGCGRKGPLFMEPTPVKPVPTASPILNPAVQTQPETKK